MKLDIAGVFLDGIFGDMSSLHYSDGDRWQGRPPLNARITHWEPAGEVLVKDACARTHTHTHTMVDSLRSLFVDN